MATASDLRRHNQARVLRALLGRSAATKAELARAVGLSQPATGAIVDELLAAAILEIPPAPSERSNATDKSAATGKDAAARMGRPGQLVRLDRTRHRFVAIELGVTHTQLAPLPVSVEGLRWTSRIPTPRTPAEWVKRVAGAMKSWPAGRPVEAILLSAPGVVDERNGQVLLCPNLRWVEKVNLPELLQPVCPVPVLIVQEIRALALGQLAADPTGDDFLLVDICDGVGSAAVIGARLFESPLPLSGELGHDPVWGNQRRCGCGAVGCVETLIARRGLLASFAGAERRGPHTWAALTQHIVEHGVPRWLADALDATAMAIAGALNVLGVRRVIVTGILNELPPAVMAHLARAVSEGAMWARFGQVACESAPRRRMAGLVSAAIDRMLLQGDDESADRLRLGRTGS